MTTKYPKSGDVNKIAYGSFSLVANRGTIEKVTYTAKDYSRDAGEYEKVAYVYLPYGYDPEDTEIKYDVLYLLHGGNDNEKWYFGDERSYLDRSCVQVCVFDDRVEVMSPGMLYGGIDIETAKLGKSTCRNEAIAEAFHYMHIVEAWGTGIPRIINKCKIYGLPDPLFEEFGDGFKAAIFRKVSNARENVSKQAEKVSKGGEKTSNTTPKISREDENISNDFEWYLPLFRKAGITDKFIANIKAVYDKCGTDVPFGQGNVQEWLECSKSKVTNVMNAMKKAEIIRKVKGLGAGKYKFVEQ